MPFLAPIRSATAGRALTRRPFVDRVGNRRVTDDFVSPQLSPQLWEVYPKCVQTLYQALEGALGGFLALTPPPTTRDGIRRRPFVNRTSSRRAMQLRSIVDRRENELASHAKWPILGEKTQSWAKKRNPGRKNRVFGTFSERFYREGGRNSEKFSRAGK